MNALVVTVLRALIRAYQILLAPILPPACRFAPSCSEYAREALERHGALRGTALAVRRVLRCHPWNEGGHDPVPPARTRTSAALAGAGAGAESAAGDDATGRGSAGAPASRAPTAGGRAGGRAPLPGRAASGPGPSTAPAALGAATPIARPAVAAPRLAPARGRTEAGLERPPASAPSEPGLAERRGAAELTRCASASADAQAATANAPTSRPHAGEPLDTRITRRSGAGGGPAPETPTANAPAGPPHAEVLREARVTRRTSATGGSGCEPPALEEQVREAR